MKKIIAATAAAAALLTAAVAPAIADSKQATAPSQLQCKAIELAVYPIMGKAARDENQQPRFTVSELRGRLMEKTDAPALKQILALAGNDYVAMLGTAKFAKDFSDDALACGIVKKDPERLVTGSSEISNVISGLLGVKLPF